jgi:flavoprotein
MAQKALIPVYILPSDQKVGYIKTKLPNNKFLKLLIREEDVGHVKKIKKWENTFIINTPENILEIFKEYFPLEK